MKSVWNIYTQVDVYTRKYFSNILKYGASIETICSKIILNWLKTGLQVRGSLVTWEHFWHQKLFEQEKIPHTNS